MMARRAILESVVARSCRVRPLSSAGVESADALAGPRSDLVGHRMIAEGVLLAKTKLDPVEAREERG
jgi:hypothetical protein